MHAQAHGITLADVRTTVNIIRPDGNTLRFDQNIHLIGDLSSAERAALLEAAANCPVRQSLSRRLEFSGIDLEPCAACP